MTTRKTFISIFTLCIALLFTACGTQDSAGTANTKDSVTKAGTEASDNSNATLNDLYQQENQLFAKHEAVWNKAFGMMNKSTVDPNGNYADYLAGTIESNKTSFTEAELKTLTEDIDAIRKIEEQIAEIENKTASDNSKKNNTETFDGNKPAIKEASAILESQGAKYRNLSIDSSSNAGKYASDIMAFPTTILVDRNGNIVGDPMLGGIDNKDNYDTLMKQIKSVIAADSNSK